MKNNESHTGRPFVKAGAAGKSFDGEKVLEGITFDFGEPGIYIVEGSSGSGKTTLLRIIAGLEHCDEGSVETNGKIGFVFQEPRLFENVSLLDNVKLAAGRKAQEVQNTDPAELLAAVGLSGSVEKLARESSGGMQQRAAICRALYFAPDILLCDEPFSAIDNANTILAAGLLDRFSEKGICIVATHGENLPFAKVKARISL